MGNEVGAAAGGALGRSVGVIRRHGLQFVNWPTLVTLCRPPRVTVRGPEPKSFTAYQP